MNGDEGDKVSERMPPLAGYPVFRRTPLSSLVPQLLLAVLALALPALLLPWARPQERAIVWQQRKSFPGGSSVTRLVASRVEEQTVLHVVSPSGGLYASADRGRSWMRLNEGLPQGRLGNVSVVDLAADPTTPPVLYAVINSSAASLRPMLYGSADLGRSWQPRASLGPERLRAVAVAPAGDALYVAAAYGVRQAALRRDGEARGVDTLVWREVAALPVTAQVSLLVASGTRLYVGTLNQGLRVLVAGDGGDYNVLPPADDAVSHTVRERAAIRALLVSSRRPEWVVVGTDEGLYTSADGGQHWRPAPPTLPRAPVLALAAAVSGAPVLYAGLLGHGVYYSDDAGVTWQPLGWGLDHAAVRALALDPASPTLYAGTDEGLWRLSLPPDTQQ
jgi:photosystem II stability/assembly factor-like uncharacterized protein